MSYIRAAVIVSGRVQGVNFRYATFRQALALGVTGWVKNLPNGNVEACIEGEKEIVEQLLSWLHDGPPSACVDNLEIERHEYVGGFKGFEILR